MMFAFVSMSTRLLSAVGSRGAGGSEEGVSSVLPVASDVEGGAGGERDSIACMRRAKVIGSGGVGGSSEAGVSGADTLRRSAAAVTCCTCAAAVSAGEIVCDVFIRRAIS